MITKEDLKFVFDNLTELEVNEAMAANEDFILLELHTTNSGGWSAIAANDYSEEVENQAGADGQIFCDKDDFLRLFQESGSENSAFEDWV